MNSKRCLTLLLTTACLSFAATSKTIALKNINIINVETLTIDKSKTILIEDDKIKAILASKSPLPGNNVIAIDMTDKYAMPGLIDTHVHHATSPDDWDNDKITRTRLRNLLRGGVTSVRDMGGDTRALSSLKRRADNDLIQSPDIYYSVIIAGEEFFSDPRTIASAKGETPGAVDWMRAVDETTDLDQVMLKARGTGATGIKIYAKVPPAMMGKLQTAAKKHGLKVWSHAFVGPARPADAIKGGVETISHAPDISSHVVDNFYQLRRQDKHITEAQKKESFELERYQELMVQMKAQGTLFDPTLTVFEMSKAQRGKRGELMYQWAKVFTRLAHEHKIKIATGTDGTSDQYQLDYPLVQKEMQLLVDDIGLTPLEAIQSATTIGAQVIGIESSHGQVKANYAANLVILNKDPSDNIKHALDIAHVIKNGEFIHRGDSKELPFVSAKPAAGMLWLSGQIGNFPSTMTLAGEDIGSQMTQAMKNIGAVLQEYDLGYNDIVKCTLMLADIKDWPAANKAYKPFFQSLPARSAFATSGLALNAKVEVECSAEL
ncbi:amidohydrolase family protein [Thalassomonas sp. RHCl1]|uniref:amidohydrolase family protein n=1 Tax=Thalassomonas sp. RHCl1 TaxID=2995320 RepID=UPI00248BC19A|nr:amidohydrolase family protein [Thalassomonas sp. RHCl1]